MRFLLDVIYPPRCPFCNILREDSCVCPNCLESLIFLDTDFNDPRLDKIWFNRARSIFAYEGVAAQAIHGFKYSLRFDLVSVFTKLLLDKAQHMGTYDIILPVPLHWRRLFRRGYNQSALLARGLAKKLKIKCDLFGLKRVKFASPQVGMDREERLASIKGSFDIRSKRVSDFESKSLLLIDDVLTTGATANECAKVLVKKGRCGKVDILTIARTV